MTYLKSIQSTIFFWTFALHLLRGAEGSPYVLSDNRIRNLDVTPVLGRGYSIMTNSFQSTCLEVDEITTPSYNYDYSFHEFTSTENIMEDLSEALSNSFGYDDAREEFIATYNKENVTATTETYYIISSMRIERYYASVKDQTSTIGTAAATLLQNQDYIGFFKACGPNYVRGIRRAQEVTAMFKFTSSSIQQASQFAASLQAASETSKDGSVSESNKFNFLTKSLQIKIKGFGLGLMEEGAETLMATSLKEFNGVMRFAFKTMTDNPNAHHIGMVYGIEIVPWVENVLFQVAANLQDDVIEIPIARSLIPRAYNKTNPHDTNFDKNHPDARDDFRCKSLGNDIDKFGYCCEVGSMYDFVAQEYNADDLDERVCRPIRALDSVFVKENMVGNGEFVARLDRALRYKTNTMATLQKCISSIRGYPSSLDANYLIPNTDPMSGVVSPVTVFDMKTAIDPLGDYSMVTHMGREIDEFISMFYSPCLNALFGGKEGISSETDASYFMAYPWYHHKECFYMSCLSNGVRWDRTNGGCVPGLMAGTSSPNYDDSDATSKCAFDTKSSGATQTCKYTAASLNKYQDDMKNCWTNSTTLATGFSVDTYLRNYCMPRVSGNKMPASNFTELKASVPQSCGGSAAGDIIEFEMGYDTSRKRKPIMTAAARAKAFQDNVMKRHSIKTATENKK